jgi:hypothetical protein
MAACNQGIMPESLGARVAAYSQARRPDAIATGHRSG